MQDFTDKNDTELWNTIKYLTNKSDVNSKRVQTQRKRNDGTHVENQMNEIHDDQIICKKTEDNECIGNVK